MSWQALNNRVIVKVETAIDHVGSIALTDPSREALMSKTGVILSVGPKANEDNGGLLQVGKRVRYNKYSGLEMDPTDDSIICIQANELLGIESATEIAKTTSESA